ncbi:MAG: DUF6879 family protein, partial [Blastocatellia bacterium]
GVFCSGHTNAAGEDIRYLRRDDATDLPDYDYWLFDSRLLVRMHFDDDESFLGGDIIEDPAVTVKTSEVGRTQPTARTRRKPSSPPCTHSKSGMPSGNDNSRLASSRTNKRLPTWTPGRSSFGRSRQPLSPAYSRRPSTPVPASLRVSPCLRCATTSTRR